MYEVCSNVNSDIVYISEAVFLITHILGRYPAPDPMESGDADENGLVIAMNEVSLIADILGGGPEPCSSCPV